MDTITLKPGRDASLRRRHPWIFSGAIARVQGSPQSGASVRVISEKGEFLGIGGYSPHSQIRVRIYAFDDVDFDADYQRHLVAAAVARRQQVFTPGQRSAYRLIYGEADGLPGLVVDRYNDFLVCQFLFAGVERHKESLVQALISETGCRNVYERSDSAVREKEGLRPLCGSLAGDPPPSLVEVEQGGLILMANLLEGHKTGLYLDQVENQRQVGALCGGKTVLNCFAYTGGFSLTALAAGAAEVTSVDVSAPALAMATDHVRRNSLDPSRHSSVEGSVFDVLRNYQREERCFDVIVLDPPKFAENKSQVMKAARAYKDLALQAARLIAPRGLLVNFSCSGAIDLNLFQKITADALLDAGRSGSIIRYLHQPADHPVALNFPESQYLKGLVSLID
jgi:23S rRNA (cytosine1962-C5)-methyltransferase